MKTKPKRSFLVYVAICVPFVIYQAPRPWPEGFDAGFISLLGIKCLFDILLLRLFYWLFYDIHDDRRP